MKKLYRLLSVTLLLAMLSACGNQGSTSTDASTIENTDSVATDSDTTGSGASMNTGASSSTNLSWSAPSTRADGSYLPIAELAGYRVYMGTSDNDLKPLVDLNDETMTNYTISDLPAGSYYFCVSAYDMNGLESGPSQIVRVQLS